MNMARWLLVAFAVIGVFALAGLRLSSPQAQARADTPVTGVFSRKPVLVQTRDVVYTLETADVRQLGGRAFVVGRTFKEDPYKLTKPQFGDSTVWVPVDGIIQVVELAPLKPEK
jgi:hypothetical protein